MGSVSNRHTGRAAPTARAPCAPRPARLAGPGALHPQQQGSAAPRGARTTAAAYQGRGPDVSERAIAALPYLLPLLDALPNGRFLFGEFPALARALAPLGALNGLYHAFPFSGFIIFLAIYAGVVNNQSMSRFARFHAAQAVVLDILLIIPQLLLDSFGRPSGGFGTGLYIQCSNTLFVTTAVLALYGMGASAAGQLARLPLVADAAESQVR